MTSGFLLRLRMLRITLSLKFKSYSYSFDPGRRDREDYCYTCLNILAIILLAAKWRLSPCRNMVSLETFIRCFFNDSLTYVIFIEAES